MALKITCLLDLMAERIQRAPKIKSTCSVATIFGPRHEKICLRGFANNKGADQPAHLRSLISAFVIRFLESNVCKLATGEFSIF